MGNNSSSTDEINAAKADMSNFSPGTPAESARPRSNSKTRRIVKAAKPSPGASNDKQSSTQQVDDDAQSEDPGYYNKVHVVPKAIAESPSVARELEIEQQQENRKDRMQSMAERQKAKREKLFQERRSGKKEAADLQPNPFSRFLSVFSVEPAHPEHKRAHEGGKDDDDELNEPDEKRLRPTEETASVDASSDGTAWQSKKTAAVAAVVVAAAAIIVALRLGRQA